MTKRARVHEEDRAALIAAAAGRSRSTTATMPLTALQAGAGNQALQRAVQGSVPVQRMPKFLSSLLGRSQKKAPEFSPAELSGAAFGWSPADAAVVQSRSYPSWQHQRELIATWAARTGDVNVKEFCDRQRSLERLVADASMREDKAAVAKYGTQLRGINALQSGVISRFSTPIRRWIAAREADPRFAAQTQGAVVPSAPQTSSKPVADVVGGTDAAGYARMKQTPNAQDAVVGEKDDQGYAKMRETPKAESSEDETVYQ